MIRTHSRPKSDSRSNNRLIGNAGQVHEATLAERWSREDLWADLAGEEIEEISFTLDAFEDLPATQRPFDD
jgi:hypothetical protein